MAAGERYRHRTLSRADVEALAVELYDWRRHLDDPDSYWVTGQRAADVLGVNAARLQHPAAVGRLPFVQLGTEPGSTAERSWRSSATPDASLSDALVDLLAYLK